MEINALTKLGPLLETHPELEEPLIGWVPAFAKLRNPILRATVAKFATLEQAAKVGNIALPDLISFLQHQLRQRGECPGPGGTPLRLHVALPVWYRTEAVVAELDAGDLLSRGDHPLAAIKRILSSHPSGAIVGLRSDFEPAPLLEQLTKEGILAECMQEETTFRILMRKS